MTDAQGEHMSDDIVTRLRKALPSDIPSEDWDGFDPLFADAIDEIERLRAALRECAADYISPPCTIPQAAVYVGEEFDRRMHIAAKALENT